MKISGLETLKGIAEGMKEEYARKTDLAAYSIEMQETAEAGCAATYRLTKDGVPVGVPINIQEDRFLKSIGTGVSIGDGVPEEGFQAGDKYIDMFVQSMDDGAEGKHLYLKFSDIMKPAAPGDGISISDTNEVSVKIDGAASNGLSVGAGGLALGLASAQSAGAMSKEDKAKLDGLEFDEITKEEARALIVSGGAASGGQQGA